LGGLIKAKIVIYREEREREEEAEAETVPESSREIVPS